MYCSNRLSSVCAPFSAPSTPVSPLCRIYKSTHKLYNEADSQGMRVYHDERIAGDVRLVMIVPSWFPKAHVSFDWERLHGDTVSVVFVIRGTMQVCCGSGLKYMCWGCDARFQVMRSIQCRFIMLSRYVLPHNVCFADGEV